MKQRIEAKYLCTKSLSQIQFQFRIRFLSVGKCSKSLILYSGNCLSEQSSRSQLNKLNKQSTWKQKHNRETLVYIWSFNDNMGETKCSLYCL